MNQPLRTPIWRAVVIYTTLAAMGLPASADPWTLSTAPAGTGYKLPAPNVIVTLDDSGSMAGTPMQQLKEAVTSAFSVTHIPDGAIRLGWNAMNRCRDIPSAGSGCANQNAVRVLDDTHRTRFLNWINSNNFNANGGTPTHQGYIAAGDYLANTSASNVNGPWASVPGETLEPVLSCRKSYSLLMTDGGWNHGITGATVTRGGNADGTARTLPDGTAYDPSLASSRIYADSWGGTLTGGTATISSMADLAFHYWATDLTGKGAGVVQPRIAEPGLRNVATDTGSMVAVQEYWNPKNDPATWQHMNTYTIGFGDAASWPSTGDYASYPVWGGDTFSGDYGRLLAGSRVWPNPVGATTVIGGVFNQSRKTEMWHMALNSRGKFIPARTADDLVNAFKDILNEIMQDTSAPVASLAGSSRSTRLDSAVFLAGYDASSWTGQVRRREVAADTGAFVTDVSKWKWGSVTSDSEVLPRSTADIMDAKDSAWPADRLVLTHSTDEAGGIAFEWSELSAAQKNALKTVAGILDTSPSADTLAQQRLAFLRGDRSLEGGTSSLPFRTRGSRHGDIVNSTIWFAKGLPSSAYTANNYATFRSDKATRPDMLYVGANDGFLHAFDAATGEEKLAYLPEGLLQSSVELTRTTYSHRYYVDGSPFTADAYVGGSWKTYLAGTLGAGGRGYFVLDATNPGAFGSTPAASLVVMDKTASVDPDVGHIMADPVTERSDPTLTRQITQLNNGRWALVMGNGYNSSSEKAVLLIQYLDGAKELQKIVADNTAGAGNGLSAPRLIDLNGDRKPDVALAGDLHGNLWKFDLSKSLASQWGVAFDGVPLHVARSGTTRQPITAAPLYLPHPNGGMMVVYGTGRNITDADRTDTQAQTVYGIYDKTSISISGGELVLGSNGSAVTDGRSSLVQQAIGASAVGTTENDTSVYQVSSNAVDYAGASAKRGWYLDLPVTGERVLDNLQWFEGDLIDVNSVVPAIGSDTTQEICTPSSATGDSYRTTINALSGAAPKSQLYAYNATGDDALTGSRVRTNPGIGLRGRDQELSVGPDGPGASPPRNLLRKTALRPSWRQLQ